MLKMKSLAIVLIMTMAMISPIAVPSIGNVAVAEAATVKISKKTLTLEVGKTKVLTVSGTKNKVTWKSSKKSVATVTSKGKVTAKAAGKATMTASVGSKKYTCKITVKEPVNQYVEDAPFDATEVKLGDISIVVPKEWDLESSEVTGDYTVTLAPTTSTGSNIVFNLSATGTKAPDYKLAKTEYSSIMTQENLQKQMELELGSGVLLSDFKASDFKINLGFTAYKVEYMLTIEDISLNQDNYILLIDDYLISIIVTDAQDFDLDEVAQYLLKTINVNK